MELLPPAAGTDYPPVNLSLGVGGIEFLPAEEISAEQERYVGSNWKDSWLVVAREAACGDPIFVDRRLAELPVFTAMHGEGDWSAIPVAPSWNAFLAAVEAFRPFTIGREHPVGVERKPLTTSEQRALEHFLQNFLGSPLPEFWGLLLDEGEP